MFAQYEKYILHFKQPSGTSRGILTTKETYFIKITHQHKTGIGECGIFKGLSYDDIPEYEQKLQWLCQNIYQNLDILKDELKNFPSILFGLEQALLNLHYGEDLYFPSLFTEGKLGIPINGLIWMGSDNFMRKQIQDKINQGFRCIKLKIGVNWQTEKKIIQDLRNNFPKEILEIRVDANGAFDLPTAQRVLEDLAQLEVHSIEQPIKTKNHKDMSILCSNTPTPIALDEELIGIISTVQKKEILEQIKPQYIILKPSLIGGFSSCNEWINLAEKMNIGWWITSALESNIGLNAIAQYTYTKQNPMPQGLGTGELFTNNIPSDLVVIGEKLWKIKTNS